MAGQISLSIISGVLLAAFELLSHYKGNGPTTYLRNYGFFLILENLKHPIYVYFAIMLGYYAFIPVVIIRAFIEIKRTWELWVAFRDPSPF